ncbi:MAG: hypothetical protein OEY51_05285 [Cyclobacteriaceae bacterium]|nr:hypothetical protein [Cyclobacteriaceae bacterium]
MKKLSNTFIAIVLLAFLSSCGVNAALVLNHNDNSTQVHLAHNNYRVLEQVSGSSEVNYIFLIGGINKRKLYNNAYAEMVEKAQLTQGSRALVNIVTEEHLGGVYPFYFKRTITVSAHVVEFVQ